MPEGMQRVGYDADTQKYTFRDRNGAFWEGSEWAEEVVKGTLASCLVQLHVCDYYSQKLSSIVSEGEGVGDVEARPDGYEPLNAGEVSGTVISMLKAPGLLTCRCCCRQCRTPTEMRGDNCCPSS